MNLYDHSSQRPPFIRIPPYALGTKDIASFPSPTFFAKALSRTAFAYLFPGSCF